jgi:hypothetical protein
MADANQPHDRGNAIAVEIEIVESFVVDGGRSRDARGSLDCGRARALVFYVHRRAVSQLIQQDGGNLMAAQGVGKS